MKNLENVTHFNFVTSEEENTVYKNSLKVLVGRIIFDYIEGLKWMKPFLPSHIQPKGTCGAHYL